jgi:hydroxymethylpyrimidine/phosphomethylpyrimidine kinase
MTERAEQGSRTVLTIAGSDSSGGAGVQADLLTFAALGVHGACALTALTAQSTVGIRSVMPVPAAFVRLQAEAVLDDLDVRFVKTGMLGTAEIVREVARLISERDLVAVVDPVLVSSSGTRLLDAPAVGVLVRELLPLAHLVTPNLPEVEALVGILPTDSEQMIAAAERILALGPRAVLVKGGHLEGDPLDVLLERGRPPVMLPTSRIDTRSTHGTGCTYASAIAALLARGLVLEPAVRDAQRFVHEAIQAAARAEPLGSGKAPVHHFHAYYPWPPPPLT